MNGVLFGRYEVLYEVLLYRDRVREAVVCVTPTLSGLEQLCELYFIPQL